MIALDGRCCTTFLRYGFRQRSHSDGFRLGRRKLPRVGTGEGRGKSNEITALAILLELLDISGYVVTADAIGCQKSIARQIIEKVGNYVLALKDNHPLLHDEVRRLFAFGEAEGASDVAISFHQSQDYDDGRKEVRRCWASAQVHWLTIWMNLWLGWACEAW